MSHFRDAYGEFRRLNAEVASVSVDSPYSHRVWGKELGIEFLMLSDFQREMLAAYDALRPPRQYLGRYSGYHTFVVAPDGTLAYVRYQPEAGGLSPVDQVLAAIEALPTRASESAG